MKPNTSLAVLAGACGWLSAVGSFEATAQQLSSPSDNDKHPIYARVDLGGNWTPDIDLKEFFGPVDAGSKVRLHPGFRAGLTGGYEVLPWLAPEIQVGYMLNKVKSITGATRLDEVYFGNVPILANVRLQYRNSSGLIPYIGAGVGTSISIIEAEHLDIGGTSVKGSAGTAVFAYQAFGGLRYEFNKHMGVCVEYRYFAADSPNWDADTWSGTTTGSMKFGRSQTHTVSLGFEYHF